MTDIPREAIEAAGNAYRQAVDERYSHGAAMDSALRAALPFLAPKPSEGDHDLAMNVTEDIGFSYAGDDQNSCVTLVAAALAAVRAEERERIEAAVRSGPCLDEDGKVVETAFVISAIRARGQA